MENRTHPNEGKGAHPTTGEGKPTVRQVYALAYALCAAAGIRFPRTRADASRLIEQVRLAIGHPRPALDDNPLRAPMRPKFDWRAAAARSRRRRNAR
jgi:hypothetical protein